MAEWSYTKTGRRTGIITGLCLSLIPAIWWWKVGGGSALNIWLPLFLVNGIVACGSYLGRLWDSWGKLKQTAKDTTPTNQSLSPTIWQTLKKGLRFALICAFSLLALVAGALAVASHTHVLSQFTGLPQWLIYTIYFANTFAILSSLASRLLDTDRAPTINTSIKWGVLGGGAALVASFTISYFVYQTRPITLLKIIANNAHGTAGLSFGPLNSGHGIALALLSFFIVGASVGEYIGKIRLAGKNINQKTRLTEDTSEDANKIREDLEQATKNSLDFKGAKMGAMGGSLGYVIVAVFTHQPLNTAPQLFLGGLELLLATFTMSALCARIGSVFDGFKVDWRSPRTASPGRDGMFSSPANAPGSSESLALMPSTVPQSDADQLSPA